MYKSKIVVSTKTKQELINRLNEFLKKNKSIRCKSLKRRVHLTKLPEILINRHSSYTHRLKRFFLAIDILKNEKKYLARIN